MIYPIQLPLNRFVHIHFLILKDFGKQTHYSFASYTDVQFNSNTNECLEYRQQQQHVENWRNMQSHRYQLRTARQQKQRKISKRERRREENRRITDMLRCIDYRENIECATSWTIACIYWTEMWALSILWVRWMRAQYIWLLVCRACKCEWA